MMSRKCRKILTVVAVIAFCMLARDGFPQGKAQNKLGGGADIGIVSKYIWRGVVMNDDAALQPDVYLTYGNFLASIWGSLDMTGREDLGIDSNGDFSELDYVIQYTIPTRLIDLSVGYSFFTYPNTPEVLRDSTQEVYVKGAFNVLLEPTLEMSYDVDEVEGWYGRASATYTQKQESQEWKLRGSVGFASEEFANYYFGGQQPIFDSSSFCDLEVRLYTTFNLGMNFGLTPFAAFSYLLDSEIRDAYENDGEFFAGLNVSWAF